MPGRPAAAIPGGSRNAGLWQCLTTLARRPSLADFGAVREELTAE